MNEFIKCRELPSADEFNSANLQTEFQDEEKSRW